MVEWQGVELTVKRSWVQFPAQAPLAFKVFDSYASVTMQYSLAVEKGW